MSVQHIFAHQFQIKVVQNKVSALVTGLQNRQIMICFENVSNYDHAG